MIILSTRPRIATLLTVSGFLLVLAVLGSPLTRDLHAQQPPNTNTTTTTAIRFVIRMDATMPAPPPKVQVFVMLAPGEANANRFLAEPRFGPNWFQPQPFASQWASNWKPGTPFVFDPSQPRAFPAPLNTLPPGVYSAQAVVRLNPHTHALGDGEGNAFSPPVTFTIPPKDKAKPQNGKDATDQPKDADRTTLEVALTVNARVPAKRFRETDRLKLVDIPSPMLERLDKAPARHRAAVILPEGVIDDKRPSLYIVPGFGGDHMSAQMYLSPSFSYGKDFVRVILDPDCGAGHHVFADNAVNGPRGRALVEELIPYLEEHFPIRREPQTRLLNGHSSGGWSVLWLKMQYPKDFGAVWSTSPDPVDFRSFTGINIYEPNANLYRTAGGDRRPIARQGEKPILWVEPFAKMEHVLGAGGQLGSFETVFGPTGSDGMTRPLFHRSTGAIDPIVAEAWKNFDIRRVLEKRKKELIPDLRGKLHIVVGSLDTFYLEEAVRLLEPTLKELGADAEVVYVPNRNHFDVLDRELAKTFARQMDEEIAKVTALPAAKSP